MGLKRTKVGTEKRVIGSYRPAWNHPGMPFFRREVRVARVSLIVPNFGTVCTDSLMKPTVSCNLQLTR